VSVKQTYPTTDSGLTDSGCGAGGGADAGADRF